nr:MAG TPA: hypothetical protein [Microviridae sp.]
MTCYHPITAYWSRTLKTKLGTPAITFKYSDADLDDLLSSDYCLLE